MIFMAKRLKITKNKTSESFYVIDDFTDPKTKKRSTFIVERLGNLAFLMDKYHTDSRDVVLSKLKEYIAELREKDKAESAEVTLTLQPAQDIPKDEERLFNIGYLYIRNIMTSLGIKKICEEIKDRSKFQFDLFNILCDLVCTRIIFPGSKRSSFHDASHFFHDQTYQLEDVYRALPVLAREKYFIEKELYKNSSNLYDRNTAILYYDCTNFYFEMEDETDFIKYGKCKENRPNPIVQYGLFMDTDGIPMSDITFEGNKNEQFSLRELEMRIMNDFKLSRFVVCADAGLNGIENKIFNDKKNEGAYIVTQPIKKLNKKLKAWATDKTTGWRLEGHEGTFNISELAEYVEINGKTYRSKDLVFYKDVWTKTKR